MYFIYLTAFFIANLCCFLKKGAKSYAKIIFKNRSITKIDKL